MEGRWRIHLTVLPPLSLTSLYPPMQCFPPGPPPGSQSCRGARCSQFPLTLAHGSASRWKAWLRTQPAAQQNLAREPSQVHSVAAPVDRAWCKKLKRRKVSVEHPLDLLRCSFHQTLGKEVDHCRCHSWHQLCSVDSTWRRRNPGRLSLVLGRRACNPRWRRCCQWAQLSPKLMLYGGGVDPLVVEELLHTLGHSHVLRQV